MHPKMPTDALESQELNTTCAFATGAASGWVDTAAAQRLLGAPAGCGVCLPAPASAVRACVSVCPHVHALGSAGRHCFPLVRIKGPHSLQPRHCACPHLGTIFEEAPASLRGGFSRPLCSPPEHSPRGSCT